MGDIFIEQIVKKKITGQDILIRVGIAIAAIALFLTSLIFLGTPYGSYVLVLGVGALWLGYRLISALNVEYEYIMTNNELDIDKIFGKRKRRRLLTVKVSSFKSYHEYKPEDLKENVTTKIIAATKLDKENAFSARFNHSKFGECLLVFSPNGRVQEEVKKYTKFANK